MRIRTPKCTDKKENKRRKRSKRNSTYRDIYRNTYRGEKTLFLSLFRGTPIYLSLRVANSECEIAAQRRNFDGQGFRFFLSLSPPPPLHLFLFLSPVAVSIAKFYWSLSTGESIISTERELSRENLVYELR